MTRRAAFFIDGFNLYHSIDDLGKPWLKWLDLWKLSALLIPQESEALVRTVYCSAFATHMPSKLARHRAYVAALRASGVECVMGKFKKKHPTKCNNCGHSWRSHEEKESDVSLAIHLIDGAHRDEFDHAYLITADSDLASVVRLLRQRFPKKLITTVSPPGRRHAGAIRDHATGKIAINENHLEKCQLPQEVRNEKGAVIATRPEEYYCT